MTRFNFKRAASITARVLATAVVAAEPLMAAVTELFPDTYSAVYPTKCRPVTKKNTFVLERAGLAVSSSRKNFVVTGLLEREKGVFDQKNIIVRSDRMKGTDLETACNGDKKGDGTEIIAKPINVTAVGQFIPQVRISPRAVNVTLAPGDAARDHAIEEALKNPDKINKGFVVNYYSNVQKPAP
jgi:hypothetical protein